MRVDDMNKLRVGLKSSIRAIKEHPVEVLLIAQDAEQHVTRRLLDLAQKQCVTVKYVDSMKALGHICHIDVGAAAAVILK